MDPSAIIAKAPASGPQASAGTTGAAATTGKAGAKPSGAAFLLALQNLGVDAGALGGLPTADADGAKADGEAEGDGADVPPTALDEAAAALAAALAASTPKAILPTATAAVETKAGGKSDGAAANAAEATTVPAPAAGTATTDVTAAIVDDQAHADTKTPAPAGTPSPADAARHAETTAQAGVAKAVADPLPGERVSSVEPASNGHANKTDGTTGTEPQAPVTREHTPQHGAGQGSDPGFGQHGTNGKNVEMAQAISAESGDSSRPAESAVSSHAAPVTRDTIHPAAPAAPTPLRDVEEIVRLASLRGTGIPRDGGEMRLHVASDSLGNVEVHVSVQQDGVHATLLADHDHARQALQASRSSLEAALLRSSLKLEGFTVDVGSQHQQQQSQGRQEPSPAQVFSKWFGPASPDGAIASVVAAATQPAPAYRGALSLHA